MIISMDNGWTAASPHGKARYLKSSESPAAILNCAPQFLHWDNIDPETCHFGQKMNWSHTICRKTTQLKWQRQCDWQNSSVQWARSQEQLILLILSGKKRAFSSGFRKYLQYKVQYNFMIIRSARTSYRESVRPPVPSTRPIHPQQFFLSS